MSITIANQTYGTMDYGGDLANASVMDAAPRHKYKFVAEILPAVGNPILVPSVSINLPEISVENKVVQQYNIKRVIQQKINYGTCTLEIVDTYDNRFTDNIYLPYFSNYYNGNNGLGTSSSNSQQLPTQTGVSGSGIGYTSPASQNRIAIPFINIYMDGGPNPKTYQLINCFITSVNNNTLDYSDSGLVTYTVTVQPEIITIGTPSSEINTESATSAGILDRSPNGSGQGGAIDSTSDDFISEDSPISGRNIIEQGGIRDNPFLNSLSDITPQGIQESIEDLEQNFSDQESIFDRADEIIDGINQTLDNIDNILDT